MEILPGKGGALFSDFAAMCANVGGAKIVVCINGFTDTTNSAAAFAEYALTNHIPVAAWELCNEPYVFSGTGPKDFFLNATDYVAQMKPYRDAIKAADSNAVVAIYFNDAGEPEPNTWDNDLKNYTDKYWDAVVYHHYPLLPTNGVPFSDLMALDNWELASNTTVRMLNYLIPDNNSNVTFLITEYAPARGDGMGGQNPPCTTLYGGIYAAEYVLRMSTLPQMSFVGPYQLLNPNGIDQTNNNFQAVTTAYNAGRSTNTAGLKFGFYLGAQVAAEAVADWALTRSTAVYATTVGTNGPTVPMDTNGITTIPAIYAQSLSGRQRQALCRAHEQRLHHRAGANHPGRRRGDQSISGNLRHRQRSRHDQRAATQQRHPNPIAVDQQSGHDSGVFRGAAGMDGFQRAAAFACGDRVQRGADAVLDGVDERDLQRPGRHQPFGNLGNAGEGFQQPDQLQFYELEHRDAAILPSHGSLTVVLKREAGY